MANESHSEPNDSHFRERKEEYIKKRVEEDLLKLELRSADTYSFGFLLPLWLLMCTAPAVWYLVKMVIEGMFERTFIDWTIFITGTVLTVLVTGLLFVVIGRNIKELARMRAARRILKIRMNTTHRIYL
jgi:hypothetical protein